jgi:hypothetical protein
MSHAEIKLREKEIAQRLTLSLQAAARAGKAFRKPRYTWA